MGQPQFQVLGIPVHVSIWHLLTLLFFFQSYFQISVQFGLAMLLAASLSVFLHEMGHALTSRAFQLQPTVVLTGFGGFTAHQPARRPRDEFLIVAAGPTVNFLIAVTCFLAETFMPGDGDSLAPKLLGSIAWLNIVWGIYNLLPIMPLDGGQLMRVLLRRTIKKTLNADRWTHRIGLVVGALAAVGIFVAFRSIFGALLLGLAAFENWRALKNLDEIDVDRQVDRPHERVRELLDLARQRFEAEDWEGAMRYCHQARAEPALSPEEAQHAWHILAVSAARLGDLDDAIRFAERLPRSKEMAVLQAGCLTQLNDPMRVRTFLRTPAALLLPEDRLEQLRNLVRAP